VGKKACPPYPTFFVPGKFQELSGNKQSHLKFYPKIKHKFCNRKLDLIAADIVQRPDLKSGKKQTAAFNNQYEEKINGFRNRFTKGGHSKA
jgi:hypothetical protein